jgi:hypothetical protein
VHFIYYAIQPCLCCQIWAKKCRTSKVKFGITKVNGVSFIKFLLPCIKFGTPEMKFGISKVNGVSFIKFLFPSIKFRTPEMKFVITKINGVSFIKYLLQSTNAKFLR